MGRFAIKGITASLLLFCAAALAVAPVQGDTAFLVDRAESVLGAKTTGREILGPYAEAISALKRKPHGGDAAGFDSLVDAINGGADAHALAAKVADGVRVDDQFGFQFAASWKYGTYNDNCDLVKYLLQVAKAKQAKAPDRAAAYAKAALVVATLCEVQLGSAPLIDLSRTEKDFPQLAELDTAQTLKFNDLVASAAKYTGDVGTPFIAMMVAEDGLIKSTKPFGDPSLLKQFVASAERMSGTAKGHLDQQFAVVHSAWEVLNLARIQKDQVAESDLSGVLGKMRDGTNSETVKRWITEALNTEGEAPTSHVRVLTAAEVEEARQRNGTRPQ